MREQIKLLIVDVDGIMTDGIKYYNRDGEVKLKTFPVRVAPVRPHPIGFTADITLIGIPILIALNAHFFAKVLFPGLAAKAFFIASTPDFQKA